MSGSLIETALSQYGVKEIPGEENNPEILKYFQEIGQEWVKTELTSWCSAYVNWVAKTEGYEYSGKLDARSWLNVGESVFHPKIGDLVILWRVAKKDWRGHVGFYINEDDIYFNILGGNQSNQVCIKEYLKTRLLEFRRLRR